MSARSTLVVALIFNSLLLLYFAQSLSITYHGARIIYEEHSAIGYILRALLDLFGSSDIVVRAPLILMNSLSALLLYAISADYISSERERVWLVVIFLLLPGVISSSLLVDGAAFVTLALFFYVYLRKKVAHYADLMLPFMLIAQSAFLLLFASLSLYAFIKKEYRYMVLYLLLFCLSLYLHGFNTGGLPMNQFLDTLGLYGALFSPVIFLYIIYVLYHRIVLKQIDLLLIISSSAFVLSLLLSFRQRVEVEMFAPYLLLSLPLIMQTYCSSYRVRLPQFRKRYKSLFVVAMLFLLVHVAVALSNKIPYRFLDNPSSYFAYRTHVANELSSKLKQMGIECIDADDKKMQLRLKFYGIKQCDRYKLHKDGTQDAKSVTISYFKTEVAKFYVSDLHK